MNQGKSIKDCAVPGCSTKRNDPESKHKFPKNEDVGRQWVDAVKCEELKRMPYANVGQRYCVCIKHFNPIYISKRNGSNFLLPHAVPTLNLPAEIVPIEKSQADWNIQKDELCNGNTSRSIDCKTTDTAQEAMDYEMIDSSLQPKSVALTINSAKASSVPRQKAQCKQKKIQNNGSTAKAQSNVFETNEQRQIRELREQLQKGKDDIERLRALLRYESAKYFKEIEAARLRVYRAKKRLKECRLELNRQRSIVTVYENMTPDQRILYNTFAQNVSKERRFDHTISEADAVHNPAD